MAEQGRVTGMVLSSMPIGEYDKRVVILTLERGKVSGFMRGARKPGSSLMAPSEPFAYGTFGYFEGKNSLTFTSASVIRYFEELRTDLDASLYGSYFLEFAGYYGRENADNADMVKLLYTAVSALCRNVLPKKLIRLAYELRIMTVNGEGPAVSECVCCRKTEGLTHFSQRLRGVLCGDCTRRADTGAVSVSDTALYALQYMAYAPYGRLFAFMVKEDVMAELDNIITTYRKRYIDYPFRSLEMIKEIPGGE